MSRYDELCAEHGGRCPSATTSPPTSATSTRATSWRWSGSASTALAATSAGASCRTSPTRRPTCCAPTGSSAASASPSCSRRRPRPRPSSSARGRTAAILLSMSVLYGDEGIAHRLRDSQPRVLVTDEANAGRFDPSPRRRDPRARRRAARRRRDRLRDGRHRRRRPGAALLHVAARRAGQGHRPRPPLRARARGVPLLPRGPGRRALPRHGRVGVGGRHRAAARAVAARRRPGRAAAQGRLRSRPAAATSSAATRSRTSSRRRPRCAR